MLSRYPWNLGTLHFSVADGISHSLKDINVEMIKDKPSEFIEENIIGPFLIGKSNLFKSESSLTVKGTNHII